MITVLEVAVEAAGYVQLTYDLWGSGTKRHPHRDPTKLLQAQRITCVRRKGFNEASYHDSKENVRKEKDRR